MIMTVRPTPIRSILFVLTLFLGIARSVQAQNAPPAVNAAPSVQRDSVTPVAGPVANAMVSGFRMQTATSHEAPVAAPNTQDQGAKLMIVGVAAVLTGIVVGNNAGHAISVGGALVGLYGLYQYLQ